MKKTILRAFLALSIIGIGLTSCLGDSNTKIDGYGQIAYVKFDYEKLFRNFAISGNVAFTNEFVTNSLLEGKFYDMDYKISTDKGTYPETNVYHADHVALVGEGHPYPSGIFTSTVRENEKVELVAVNISAFSADDFINDNWAFTYTCKAYETDGEQDDLGVNNFRLVATLDSKAQVKPSQGEIEKELDKDQVIIKLHLERVADLVGGGTKPEEKVIPGRSSIYLGNVRSYLTRRLESELPGLAENEYKVGAILFQYDFKNSNGTIETRTVGNGSLNVKQPVHWMAIKK